jgi:Holliday junction resolvasome RuvABC endonuclease subunit
MVAQLLRLREPPAPADAADGVALALTHLLIATRQAAFFSRVTGAR